MLKYILKKIAVAMVTILIIVTAVFLLVRKLPGDPFMDPKVPPETQQKMHEYYGLDKPMFEQYITYMGNLLRGDLGTSLRTQNRSINEVLIKAFPYSIDLGLRALIFAVVAGLFLGILAALHQNQFWDHFGMTLAVIGVSIPSFIIGTLLQYFLAVRWKIFPVARWDEFASTILPTFALGFGLVLVTLILIMNLVHSREGRAIRAIRDNNIAAESIGLNVTAFKMKAFVISAVLAGMAGVLFAMNYSAIEAKKFNFNTSISVLVMVVLGGMGSLRGSVIAAVVLTVLPEALRGLEDYRMLIYAIVLIAVMVLNNNLRFQQFKQAMKDRLSRVLRRIFRRKEAKA